MWFLVKFLQFKNTKKFSLMSIFTQKFGCVDHDTVTSHSFWDKGTLFYSLSISIYIKKTKNSFLLWCPNLHFWLRLIYLVFRSPNSFSHGGSTCFISLIHQYWIDLIKISGRLVELSQFLRHWFRVGRITTSH